MSITAAQVKSLRDKTGVSMGDCKKALVESEGNEDQAIEILNKKYAGQLGKRADKEAANGRIGAYSDGKNGALIELRCETDFVAKSDDFRAAADAIAAIVCHSGETDVEKLATTAGADGKTVTDIIAGAYGKLKENLTLSRASIIPGGMGSYVHHNGLNGTVVAGEGDGGEIARQVCMHLAAMPVDGLDRSAIDESEIEKAREVMMEQAKGKPPEIAEKIVTGKMDRWFSERVLLEQPFIIDDKKSVQEAAKEAGLNITGYLKYELGVKS